MRDSSVNKIVPIVIRFRSGYRLDLEALSCGLGPSFVRNRVIQNAENAMKSLRANFSWLIVASSGPGFKIQSFCYRMATVELYTVVYRA